MKPLKNEFPVVLHQDVIWGDMDAFGHVNNTVYFRYFEDARIAYFERIGVFEYMRQHRIGPVLASASTNFRLPLDFPDRVHIGMRGVVQSPRKLSMEYAVYSERHGRAAAEGSGLIVYYDYDAGKSRTIPGPVVAAIDALEKSA